MRFLLVFLVLPAFTSAQNIQLLENFGDHGIVKFERGFSSTLRCLNILPDGRIMLHASWADTSYQIRLTPDGMPDPTFGIDGVLPDVHPKMSLPNDIEVLPNGQYLALRLYSEGTFIPQMGFGITKHHPNGDLDTTFGVAGRSYTILGNYAIPQALSIQTDGKIVALGFRTGQVGVLARFYPDGQIDSTFDENGVTLAHIDFPFALTIQPNGRLLAAGARGGGYPDLKMALVRYKENGSLDSTFATNGAINTYFGLQTELAVDILVRPNGKIVLGGWVDPINNKFAIAQFNSNGTPDMSFGTGGLVTTSFPYGGTIYKLALLPDGKLLAFGYAQYIPPGPESPYYSVIARYNVNGSLDPSFGQQGLFQFIAGEASSANLRAIYMDGSYVIGGDYYPLLSGPPHFYVARTAPFTSPPNNVSDLASEISVYPNPATDRIVIQWTEDRPVAISDAGLYDMNGRRVEVAVEDGGAGRLVLRFSGQLSGAYMYRIVTPDRVFSGKLIIIHFSKI